MRSGLAEFLRLTSEIEAQVKADAASRAVQTPDGRTRRVGPRLRPDTTALRRVGERATVRAAIEAALADPETPFADRARILDGIAAARSVRLARIALRTSSTHDDPDVRWYGLQTAFLAGARWFGAAFLAALGDAAPRVRAAAASYLGRGRSRVAVRTALLRVASSGSEAPEVRCAAVRSLGAFEGREVSVGLVRLASDPDGAVRAAANQVRGFRGDLMAVVGELGQRLPDESRRVDHELVLKLFEAGVVSLADLRSGPSPEDPAVRDLAARVLAHLDRLS